MTERKHIIDNLSITYSGVFNMKDLYSVIDKWLQDNRYDKREIRNMELVREGGKYLELELLPWRKVTDYTMYEIKVRIFVKDLVEVDIEKDGKKAKMDKGDVTVILDGFLVTDYENVWEARPVFYFLRTIVDKYILRVYTNRFENGLRADVKLLHRVVKGLLNLGRYTK